MKGHTKLNHEDINEGGPESGSSISYNCQHHLVLLLSMEIHCCKILMCSERPKQKKSQKYKNNKKRWIDNRGETELTKDIMIVSLFFFFYCKRNL